MKTVFLFNKWSIALFLVLVIVLSAVSQTKYKVGESVDISPSGNGRWQRGKIVSIEKEAYLVRFDSQAADDDSLYRLTQPELQLRSVADSEKAKLPKSKSTTHLQFDETPTKLSNNFVQAGHYSGPIYSTSEEVFSICKDDYIQIQSKGRIIFGPSIGFGLPQGPLGVGDSSESPFNVVKGFDHGALLLRTGDATNTSDWVLIGYKANYISKVSGLHKFEFLVNDNDPRNNGNGDLNYTNFDLTVDINRSKLNVTGNLIPLRNGIAKLKINFDESTSILGSAYGTTQRGASALYKTIDGHLVRGFFYVVDPHSGRIAEPAPGYTGNVDSTNPPERLTPTTSVPASSFRYIVAECDGSINLKP